MGHEVVQTSLRPDLVIWVEEATRVIPMVQLEDGCEETSEISITQQCRNRDVTSLVISTSGWDIVLLTATGIMGKERKTAVGRLVEAVVGSGAGGREELNWKTTECGQWLAITADPPTEGWLRRRRSVGHHLMRSSPGRELQSLEGDI